MFPLRNLTAALLIAATIALAGCESTETKAERLYEQSLELVEKGETERAIVTLKSVFDLNGQHEAARMLYADLNRDAGNLREAYRHYLLVAEQYPKNLEARIDLAELAIDMNDWEAANRQAAAAAQLAPDNPRVAPLVAAVAYQDAVKKNDSAAVAKAVADAQKIVEADPDNLFARKVVLDSLLRGGDVHGALEELDAILALDPSDEAMNRLKLAALVQVEDNAASGEQLRKMVSLFPAQKEYQTALVRWYLVNGDRDGAEAFIRDLIAKDQSVETRLMLVEFLRQVKGSDAAIAELDTMIAAETGNAVFRTLRAGIQFDTGKHDEAMASLEEALATIEPSDDQRKMQMALANMKVRTGDLATGRKLTEEVLAVDATNVDALKLKASWLVQEDKVRDAVLALRTALDQAPTDADALTLLAAAYERDGNRELMGESLLRATEASNYAAVPSLRYAKYLMVGENYLTAEDILKRALQVDPTNLNLLTAIGEVYIALSDWPRAQQVIDSLGKMDLPEADSAATTMELALLQRMQRTEESVTLLRNYIDEGKGGLGAQAAMIQTHLANGDLDKARAYMDEVLASAQSDKENLPRYQFLNAALLVAEGKPDEASGVYRDLVTQSPTDEIVWRAYVSSTANTGDTQNAISLADEALKNLPESYALLWIKAGLLEKSGDIDGSIDIYRKLYEQDSNSVVVANNLASMITTYKSDDKSLQDAFVIARRLRGTNVPAFQDTYGWIAFRLGNKQEAIENLEPAAKGLSDNPSVQYHLAAAYAANDRRDEAISTYRKAIELWGDDETNPERAAAEAELAALLAAPAGATSGATGATSTGTAPAAPTDTVAE
jgi:tetratricopeptide (TPR) repeat protein